MEQNGQAPGNGPVVVTGATGGVGSLAISMLAGRGYEVVAVSGKPDADDYLRTLGAARTLRRQDIKLGSRPMETAQWAGAIDNVGGEHLESGRANGGERIREVNAHGHRNVEQRPRGRANDLGVVQVDTAPSENHGVGTSRISNADDRAQVARVAHLFEDGDQLRRSPVATLAEELFERGRELAAHRNETLRRDRIGHRVDDLFGGELDIHTRVDGRSGDVAVAFERRGRSEQLDNQLGSISQRLSNGLRALQQEEPGF